MQTFPHKIVDRFWNSHEPTRKKFGNKLNFLRDLQSQDPDFIELMANDVYERSYSDRISREEFDSNSGMETWRDAQPSWLWTVGQNMTMRAADLGAGLARSIDAAAWWLEDVVPGKDLMAGYLRWSGVTPGQLDELAGGDLDKLESVVDLGGTGEDQPPGRPPKSDDPSERSMFRQAATDVERFSDRHTLNPRVTWDEFKDSPVTQFIPFAMEQGLISLPDMAAAVAVLPVYVAARTGEIGQERAENDMRDQATSGDLLNALPAAAASSMLDRFGAQKLFGMTDTIKDATLKEIGKAAGRRAAIESGTEALQEPIEQTGAALGTERWARMTSGEIASELGQASAQGAVVGLGFGGSVSIPSLALEASRHKRNAGGEGELPADIQDEVDRQKEAAREYAEQNLQENEEAVAEGKPRPRPRRPEEAPAGPAAAEQGVTPPETTADDVQQMSDADRSVDSMVLEEEVKLNKRRPLSPVDVAVGDRVVVDDGQQPATGTVEVANDRLVRIVDDEGSPIAVLRPDRPVPSDSRLYSLSETQVEEERDPELEQATAEMGRLIKRAIDNPDDTAAIEDLRKLRNGKEFGKLPEQARDQIDTFLGQADQRIAAQEEEARAAEEQRKAEERETAEREKAEAKEREDTAKFQTEVETASVDIPTDRVEAIRTRALEESGAESIETLPPEQRPAFIARMKRIAQEERTASEAEAKADQERADSERQMTQAVAEMNRLIERTRQDPTDMAAVEAQPVETAETAGDTQQDLSPAGETQTRPLREGKFERDRELDRMAPRAREDLIKAVENGTALPGPYVDRGLANDDGSMTDRGRQAAEYFMAERDTLAQGTPINDWEFKGTIKKPRGLRDTKAGTVAHVGEWWTNGYIAVRGPLPKGYNDGDFGLSAAAVQRVVPKSESFAPAEPMMVETGEETDNPAVVFDNGQATSSQYYRLLEREVKGGAWVFSADYGRFGVMKNGEVVGVVMPLPRRHDNPVVGPDAAPVETGEAEVIEETPPQEEPAAAPEDATDKPKTWGADNNVSYAVASERDVERLTGEWGPKAALQNELREIVARLVPDARLNAQDRRRLVNAPWAYAATVTSADMKTVIDVALRATRDPRSLVRHEAIHALNNMGLFSRAEWVALEQAAQRGDWIGKHDIRKRYPGMFHPDGTPTLDAIEEAIADEFADWHSRKKGGTDSNAIRRVFSRMVQFFRDLTARLRDHGATPTPGAIFDAVERGAHGRRRRRRSGRSGTRYASASTVQFADPDTEKRWKAASKGVDNTMPTRLVETIKEEYHRLTRYREHLPNTARFSDAREKMIHLEQSEHSAKERIAALFKRVMGGLEQPDVDLLTRKMVLDDLLWTSEQGMRLPFGLKSTEDVLDALQAVEAALEQRPELMERMAIRTEEREVLKHQMISSGVLTYKQAQNPHYFRHQVLEYAKLRAQAGGRKGKVTSTYWHSRKGSDKDINANYFQAEADWMYKAHLDIATARFLNWLRTSGYNAKREMVARAKADNMAALEERMESRPDLRKEWTKKGLNIGIAMGKLRQAVRKMDQSELEAAIPPDLQNQLRAFLRGGGDAAVTDDGGNSGYFGLIRFVADSSLPFNTHAGMVLATTFNRRKFLKDTLGDDYINPQNMRELVSRYAADTHTAWQPDSKDGKRAVHIFTGKTVSEHVLDRALSNLKGIIGNVITADQVSALQEMLENGRDVRMLGGPMEELILPNEIAITLDEFHDNDIGGMLDALAVTVTGRWKQWTLFNPARFAKYYINNMTGDTDALLATRAGKGVAKQLPRAFKDVKRMLYDQVIDHDLNEALEKGVVQSSLVMQEITGMGTIADDAFRPERVKGVLKWGSKYFDQVQRFARLRENAFRYAAYLHYKQEIASGKSMLEMGYGATPPWMAEAITDPDDRAARMARDLLGDYGSIPYRARWARKRLIPFVSWIASNTTRYNNLFRNAYLTGRDVSKARGAAMGAYAAGGLVARMFIVYAAVNLWNNLLFGEDEELLGSEERMRLHLNLGRWGGDVVTLRFQGALSDYMGWVGFEDAGAVISEVQAGRASYSDIIGAIAKAPVNKLAQGVTPLYKLPLEQIVGRQFFPDVFNPRSIRDRSRHSARTFSLDYPIAMVKQMLGEAAPVRDPLKTVAGAVVKMRDPGEMAYNSIRGRAFSFIENETGSSIGGAFGPRSNALYNWRVALKRGDTRSARLALDRLRELGATGSSLRSSIKRASPLGMFPNRSLRNQFVATLSPKERDVLKRASQWYSQTFTAR